MSIVHLCTLVHPLRRVQSEAPLGLYGTASHEWGPSACEGILLQRSDSSLFVCSRLHIILRYLVVAFLAQVVS